MSPVVMLNNGQTLTSEGWFTYDTDHKGELDMLTAKGEIKATFAPNTWRYVYEDFAPEVANPTPVAGYPW